MESPFLPIRNIITVRTFRQIVATVAVNVVTLCYGIILGWASPSILLLRSEASWKVTEEDEHWLGSLQFLGAFVSSPVYSYINQNLGRKAAGYLAAVPIFIGFLLIIFGNSLIYLYTGRFITGLSLSGVNVFITMYIGEISEDSVRGTLGNARGLVANVGIMSVYAIAPHFSIPNIGILAIATTTLFLLAYYWLPESPMYLLVKGKKEEAMESYKWLRGGDARLANEELDKLSRATDSDSDGKASSMVTSLLFVRGTRRALLLVLVWSLVQAFSGLYMILSYGGLVLEKTGSSVDPKMSSLIIASLNILGSCLTCIFSDIVGRRLIMVGTQLVEGVCHVLMGTYLYLQFTGTDVSGVAILPVILISLYSGCAIAGFGTMMFVVISEIFRPEVRGSAMGAISSFLWLLMFISTRIFPILVEAMEVHGCFWLFASVAFAGAIYTFIELPETRNRSLESILTEFNGK